MDLYKKTFTQEQPIVKYEILKKVMKRTRIVTPKR